MLLWPTVKINPAIRLRGEYRIAQFGGPTAHDYHTEVVPGTANALSEGRWTTFWATLQTPWGVFGLGKRPWVFGTALQYDGSDAATTETVLLVVPYGPISLGVGFYPYRYAGSSPVGLDDPFDLQTPQYFSQADRSGSLINNALSFCTYSAGQLQAGILGCYGNFHIGPEAQLTANSRTAQDSDYFHGSTFVKYNNGLVFLNAEVAWLYWTDRLSDPTSAIGLPNPRYTEQWRYAIVAGFIAGPARVSLLHAWTPGPDRRKGSLIDKQSCAFVWHPTFDTHLGNFSVWRPFNYLFSYDYGSGLNAYNLSGDGYVRDACVFAARIDYALAANLQVYASFLWAERTSNGYGWGCIGPNDPQFNGKPNDGNIAINLSGAAGSPNIPDGGLGYEIDLGFDWQLLEGWTMNATVGFWQPGQWFQYACIDRSVPNWNVPTRANFFGTRPNRAIDPIVGGALCFSVSF